MASTRLMLLRRLSRALKPSSVSSSSLIERSCISSSLYLQQTLKYGPWNILSIRRFCSNLNDNFEQGLAPIDYRSILEEDEFHQLADSTIHDLLEKIEEYGDSVDIDGFDIDYGNQVLTVKLGDLGTYVLNKQTPNRQIWMSSPVSGPSRFDWDQSSKCWIYRRNKAYLFKVLESELEQLCGQPITLS